MPTLSLSGTLLPNARSGGSVATRARRQGFSCAWRALVLWWALGLGPAAVAGPPRLDLDQALARARFGHPALRGASAELAATRARLEQAGLPVSNPLVSGELARHTAPGEEATDRGVSIAQEIEIGGQRGLRVEAARWDVQRAEHELADRTRSVEVEVRRSFAALVAADERRQLATEAVALAQLLLDTVERRARAGDVGNLDVRLAQVEKTRAEQALALAETQRLRATSALASALGADPEEAISVVAAAIPSAAPSDAKRLVAHGLAFRPDLAAARAERDRLQAEARLAHRRGWIPNPTVRAFFRHELDEEDIAGGEVTLPLPIWNREQGTEAAFLASSRRLVAEVDRLEREVPRQVQLAFARRSAAVESWARYETESLPAATAASGLLERAYASGYLGLVEALGQRDRLLQVRAAAIDAELELRESEADLIEAVGGRLP